MLRKAIEYVRRYRFRVSMIVVNAVISTLPVILIGILVHNIIFFGNVKKLSSAVDANFVQINNQLDNYFENVRQFSKIVFFDDRVMDILKNDSRLEQSSNVYFLRDYLSTVMQMNLNIKDIYIVTSEQRQAGTNNIALGDEVADILEQNRNNTGEFSFLVSAALIGKSNADIIAQQNIRYKDTLLYAGTGAILLNKQDFIKSLDGINQIEEMSVFVTDERGKLIAASDGIDFKVVEHIFDNGVNDNGFIKFGGEKYLLRKGSLPSTNWTITAIVSGDKLYSEINWLKSLIIMLVILILILTGASTLLYNLYISGYIRDLTNAFTHVASDNFDVHLDFGKGHEMAYVSEGFNSMIGEIKSLTHKALSTQQKLYETELQKTNAELYGLQSQINSHFLYNTLGSIRGMARAGRSDAVDNMISELVSILRYASDKTEFVPLSAEISNIYKYIKIQATTDRKIVLKSDIDSSAASCMVYKLILQPVVENSLIHAFVNKRIGMIKIKAICTEECLTVKVYDNGEGIPGEMLAQINACLARNEKMIPGAKRHIGLYNIQKRLKMSFGDEYGICVKSWQGRGTVLVMKLPIIKESGNQDV